MSDRLPLTNHHNEQIIENARWESAKLSTNREQFLRDKIYSIHIFLSKTLIALISTTLALSVGFLGYLKQENLHYTNILPLGWSFLIIGLILQMFMIRFALEYYYGCYNNHNNTGKEHCDKVLGSENKAIRAQRISFWVFLIGLSLILTFVYLNLKI